MTSGVRTVRTGLVRRFLEWSFI